MAVPDYQQSTRPTGQAQPFQTHDESDASLTSRAGSSGVSRTATCAALSQQLTSNTENRLADRADLTGCSLHEFALRGNFELRRCASPYTRRSFVGLGIRRSSKQSAVLKQVAHSDAGLSS